MSMEILCPQCKLMINAPSSRLVKDACGHEKCRLCLLSDTLKCKQCEIRKTLYTNISKNLTQAHLAVAYDNKDVSTVAEKDCIEKKNHTKLTLPRHVCVTTDKRYKCTICNKIFASRGHIKYHSYCGEEEKKPYNCEVCKKGFVTKIHFDNHKLTHFGTKSFTCQICGKSYLTESKLKQHLKWHRNETPHVCTQCGKGFKTKSSLSSHELIHRKIKPFACKICNRKFNNSSNLKKHVVTHKEEKAHMCLHCGKRFKLKWTLIVHEKSHFNERSFECVRCGKSFINKKDLQRHELTHLEARIFACSLCSMSFKRCDNLRRHFRNIHPGKNAELIKKKVKPIEKEFAEIVDSPNAIKVITASPLTPKMKDILPIGKSEPLKCGAVNGPLKLAFKTSAFKQRNNIQRHIDLNDTSFEDTSTKICQKIIASQSPSLENQIEPFTLDNPSKPNQTIIEPKMQIPERKSHGFKFKIPENYNTFKSHDILDEIMPASKRSNEEKYRVTAEPGAKIFTELKPVQSAETSVIVRQSPREHWRRRFSENPHS